MARKRFKPEQIIHMLREAEIKLASGSTVGEVCRSLGTTEQTYYRWRKSYGGMQASLSNHPKKSVVRLRGMMASIKDRHGSRLCDNSEFDEVLISGAAQIGM
jgi:transposase-like protein